ncbi:MAG TPA: patatin-like phospholipase family protein [Gemmatimonadales bacterium]|nr:patatin-like phospholipase family protein [Gemmatimonadales bacterium]
MIATQDANAPVPGREPAGTVRASTAAESGANAEARTIGRNGEPVRVLTFSSGGVETAMQLGVVHALLVTRAKPPDVVLGVSAGAVNAVALAEILQAGSDITADPQFSANGRDPLEHQVARFRQIFEDFQNCPHDLLDAMLPDTYQIDAQKPLKPLQLPVHAKVEREGRDDGLRSRAGLINFYNELLLLRAPVGTVARAVRRVLGIIAAREAVPKWWPAVRALEVFRLWMLMGGTLHRMAPVLWPISRTVINRRPWTSSIRKEHGVSAARLIFRSRLWTRAGSMSRNALSLLLLSSTWVFGSALVLGLVVLIGQLPLRLFKGFSGSIAGVDEALIWAATGPHRPRFAEQLAAHAPAIGAIVLSVFAFAAIYGVLSKFVTKEGLRVSLGLATGTMASFLLLLTVWLLVLIALGWATAYLVNLLAGIVAGALPWMNLSLPPLRTWHVVAAAVVISVGLGVAAYMRGAGFLVHLLARYALADSLLHPHPLRQFFVRLFDPGYYGPIVMDSVVERAIRRNAGPSDEMVTNKGGETGSRKHLDDYATKRQPPIHVALTVADISTGELSVVPGDVSTVDGLMAATARTPLFPAVPLNGKLCIDAASVATQTTEALMNFLRTRVRLDATAVHVYHVASLPLSKPELDPKKPPTDGASLGSRDTERTELVEVIGRAYQIQRFRDAHLNQKLVNLLSRVLPPGDIIYRAPGTDDDFLRAWVYPIEPEAPLDILKRLAQAETTADRRRVVAETVADGCRAALQTMITHRIRDTARTPGIVVTPSGNGHRAVRCASVIAAHNSARNQPQSFPGSAPNPSEDEARTPGLVEVCQHCALHRGDDNMLERHLVISERKPAPPDWYVDDRETRDHKTRKPTDQTAPPTAASPSGTAESDPTSDEEPSRPDDKSANQTEKALRGWTGSWPRQSGGVAAREKATVSFLFSGGVFRGVYQMGVLNALNLAGLRPDVIAGASVGSITAAMVARVFREPLHEERVARIARLAATYLTLDRLILTDRFADFVRGFTVRAAATRFSLSQADRVFRSFDKPLPGEFDRELRAVAAGLERLFYISPFELRDLVEAARRRQGSEVTRLLTRNLQEWLGRMGVGNQVLGAEPLALLIAEHVLDGLPGYSIEHPGSVPFHVFTDDGIYFLATATNLTRGKLEVLGENPAPPADERPMLLESLLASSAFPGVFRPRWSWEVMPSAESDHQYIDGGVTDNLPLDAVAQFLYRASRADRVAPRPGQGRVPHLLLCASLEPRLTVLTPGEQQAMSFNWPALRRRAVQLGYNKKIDLYDQIQRSIRQVVRSAPTDKWTPLDLEVVAVKPEWLCDTFAFHPMLGFRRGRQARSIAHGCASTLLELARPRPDDDSDSWKAAWGIDASRIPTPETALRTDPYVPLSVGPDECWFRSGVICPFSRTGLAEARLHDTTLSEVSNIYTLCGRHDTHRPKA